MTQNPQERPNLYLVGFMGTGKSAVGRRIAHQLGMRFVDMDREIEYGSQKTIGEIFAEDGEEHFRMLERRYVESGHPMGGCVVSCGGGLVVQPGMIECLQEKGVVICLFASPETILERTSGNLKRPLLNVEEPEKEIRQLLKERETVYCSAGTCISTENRSIQEVADHALRIYKDLAERWSRSTGDHD